MSTMYRIALIDDTKSTTSLISGYLQCISDVQVSTFSDPLIALSWCIEYVPDLILVDYLMPDMDGLEFISQVRADPRLHQTPVIMITSIDSKEALYQTLQLKMTDFLRKPVDRVELIARTQNMLELHKRHRELTIANDQLRRIAITDSLTGLRTRRYFLSALRDAAEGQDERDSPVCLAMIDVDHFKSVNDRYGHDGGDIVLKAVANVLSQNIRKSDLVGRLGGEEFGLLMDATHLPEATAICQRLLLKLSERPINLAGEDVFVTASIGLALHEPDYENVENLIKRADNALYAAKANGRKRVELAPPVRSAA